MTRPILPPYHLVFACAFFAGMTPSGLLATGANPTVAGEGSHEASAAAADSIADKIAVAPDDVVASPNTGAVTAVAAGPKAPAASHHEIAAPAKAPKNSVAADEIHSLLKLAPALTDRGDYESAEIAYHQVMNATAATPADLTTALLGLARMHRKQGALTKAIAIYERYLKDYPGDERSPEALLDLGRSLRTMGLHKAAIARFYSVLNSTLKLAGEGFEHYQLVAKTAQFEIAQTHFDAGDFVEANKYFTRLRLLDLAPADRARAHFMSARALRLQGDRPAAATSLRTFIEQSPDDENIPEARYLYAVTLRELKRSQEALVATLDLLRAEKSVTATDPKRWAYWQRRTGNQLANDFFEAGDALNAHGIYAGLLELSNDPNWRLPLTYQIALCAERLGRLDKARAAYQAIVDAGGATPPAELAELVSMSAWRLEHLDWRDRLDRQVDVFFNTTTGKQAAATPDAPAKAASTP